jgi:FkbM family methyltransferase
MVGSRVLAATQYIIGPAGRLDYRNGREPYVRVEAGQYGSVIFGPYTVFDSGEYDVRFDLSFDDRFAFDGRNFCWVDVTSELGTHIHAKAVINTQYVDGNDAAQILLRFAISEPAALEFRLHSFGTHSFFAKYDRSVVRIDGTVARDTTNKFYADNISKFKDYLHLGAKITPSQDGVFFEWNGIKLLMKSEEDFVLIYEVFRCNNYNFIQAEAAAVIDIGMNVGVASLYFAKMRQVQVVHSFEPFSRPFARALENFALNPQVSSKIRPNQVGLAGKNDVIEVSCSDSVTIGTSIRGIDGPQSDTITIREASAALKPLVDEAVRCGQAVVLKMDCEGSEFAILESMYESKLLGNVKVLMMEWHKWWSPEKSNNNIVEILSASGFVTFDLLHLDNPHASMIYAVRA